MNAARTLHNLVEARSSATAKAQVEAMKIAGLVGHRLLKAQLPKGVQPTAGEAASS